jgi:phage shock protein PspC (stress-responsive transcriptional regulator)
MEARGKEVVMKRLYGRIVTLGAMLWLAIPDLVWAAGEKATNLVVVADTRRVSGIFKYFANLYNTNPLLFAVWAVVLTAFWGAFLGFLMDRVMMRTGLDLKSRKIVEH